MAGRFQFPVVRGRNTASCASVPGRPGRGLARVFAVPGLVALAVVSWLLVTPVRAAPGEAERATRVLRAEDFRLFRHGEIKTGRPFAFDVDEQGKLWQGNTGEFWVHDTRTGQASRVAPPELKGMTLSSVFCFQGKIVVAHQVADHITVYDPATRKAATVALPGKKPNVWYGTKAAGKLLLFDRSDDGGVLVLDSPAGPVRKLAAVVGKFPAGGKMLPDGRVLVGTYPVRTYQFFDPVREVVTGEIPYPTPDAGLSGVFVHEGLLYAADSAAGRLVVYNLKEQRWLEPIAVPDYKKVFGFIGGGFQLGSAGYFCLSTYAHQSRLDPATGKLIVPPNADLGVDGRAHHFLDRFLVFDAATRKFSYLVAPAQPDGYPLVCYSHVEGEKVFITGYVVPLDADGGPGKKAGDWIVWERRGAGR